MTRHARIVTLVSACTLLLAANAAAQFDVADCGNVDTGATARQNGTYPAIQGTSHTRRNFNPCSLEVQAEVWIDGVGGANLARSTYYAEATQTQVVECNGEYTALGKHWVIAVQAPPPWPWDREVWFDWGTSHATARVTCTPPPPPSDTLPCDTDPAWPGCDSPILLDTAGDGFRLTSMEDGVVFDLTADGVPDQVAWTLEGSDDAWLAWDRNGNGLIDDGSELFGTHTPTYPNAAVRAANGFEALKFTENPASGIGSSRADERIDARDAIFSRLLLWRDANHNGISEPDELTPAAQTGLQAISTDYKLTERVDRHGNEFRQRSRSIWMGPNGRLFNHPVWDVWLVVNRPAPPDTEPEP
jgi:hypothetical protein